MILSVIKLKRCQVLLQSIEKNNLNTMKRKELNNERVKKLYHNNPEYREKVKQQKLARYYKSKETKANAPVSVN